jgi:hypothetical protein
MGRSLPSADLKYTHDEGRCTFVLLANAQQPFGRNSRFFFLDSEPLLKFILESGSGDGSDVRPTYIYPAPE